MSEEPTTNLWDVEGWEPTENEPQDTVAALSSSIPAEAPENGQDHPSRVHTPDAHTCQPNIVEVHIRERDTLTHPTEEIQIVTHNSSDGAFSISQHHHDATSVTNSTIADFTCRSLGQFFDRPPRRRDRTAGNLPHIDPAARTLKVRCTTWTLVSHQRNAPRKHVRHIPSQTPRLVVSTTKHPERAIGITRGAHRSPFTPTIHHPC